MLERMYAAWPRIHVVTDAGAYARTVLASQAISDTRRSWWRRERVTDTVPENPAVDLSDGLADRLDLAQALAVLPVDD